MLATALATATAATAQVTPDSGGGAESDADYAPRDGWERLVVAENAAPPQAPPAAPAAAAPAEPDPEDVEYPIVFPIDGDYSYRDTWGAPRGDGRTHKGNDIFAEKGTPVVAAADGVVTRVAVGERSGRFIVVAHKGGWSTYYLHLNNDTVGTDDGLHNAAAPGIAVGVEVTAGQVLDYVGDSGNAEGTPPHLHFEIHDTSGKATNPYPYLRVAEGNPLPVLAGTAADAAPVFVGENVAFVGRLDPGGGFAADVTVHNAVAYLGTWGRPSACPASGVRLIDVSAPAEPTALGAIASGDEFPSTSTDSVWVGAVDTPSFTGDLAVVAVRLCDTSERNRRGDAMRGLAMYDVTNPEEPVLLSTFHTGPATQGVHEVDVIHRMDRSVQVAATVLQSMQHTDGAVGDLRIVDISDPTAPRQLADWDPRRDGPAVERDTMLAEVYDELEIHTHAATWSHDGDRLWAANWDAGVALLDTTDPTTPVQLAGFGYDPESEGNAHSVAVDVAAGLLIRNDQDLINNDFERHGFGWGGQRLYDISDPAAPVEVSTFMTDRATPNADGGAVHVDGRYSAHNAQIVAGVEYVAWYADGLRIVDVTEPTAPREIGSFVPPARVDPQGYWEAPDGNRSFAMVWGVHVADHLIYVSDMNTGLWIVRYHPPVAVLEGDGWE